MLKVSGLKQKIATSNIAKNKYVQRITSQMGDKVEFKNKAKTKAKSFLKTLIVIATGIFSAIVSFLNKDKETNTTTPNTDNSTKPNNSNSAPQNPPPTTDGDDSPDGLDNDVPEAPSAIINVTEEEVETEGTTTENNVAISDDTTDAQTETTIKDSNDTEDTQIVDIAEDSDDTNDSEKSAIAVTTNTVPETKVTETPTEITPAVDIESSSGTQKADSNKKAEKTIATDKTSDVDKEKRQKRKNELMVEMDCLSAEQALYIDEYYEDSDYTILCTDIVANEKGFWIYVDLIDENKKASEEVQKQALESAKATMFLKQYAIDNTTKREGILDSSVRESAEYQKELNRLSSEYQVVKEMPSNLAVKVFESWYIKYIELCKQIGVVPRECGVAGGAFDHYLQLQQRQNVDTYPDYVKTLQYRAGYDENAFHDYVNLQVDDDKLAPAMGEMLHDLASSNNKELYSLKEVIDLIKQAPKTNWKVLDLLQALKDKEITFDNFTTKLRVIKQELKAAEEESVREKLDIDTIYQENHNYDYNDNTQYVFA